MSKFNENIIEGLKVNGAKSVFINEKGEWLFHESEGFSEYSRAEAIGEPIEEPKPKAKDKSKPKAKDEPKVKAEDEPEAEIEDEPKMEAEQ